MALQGRKGKFGRLRVTCPGELARTLSASHSTSSPRSDSNCSMRRAIPQWRSTSRRSPARSPRSWWAPKTSSNST